MVFMPYHNSCWWQTCHTVSFFMSRGALEEVSFLWLFPCIIFLAPISDEMNVWRLDSCVVLMWTPWKDSLNRCWPHSSLHWLYPFRSQKIGSHTAINMGDGTNRHNFLKSFKIGVNYPEIIYHMLYFLMKPLA